MGKKKSVVLLALITIVILVFCAISAIPSFPLSVFDKDSVKVWNPASEQYEFDADLSGGYYTLYYPEGVISSMEYDANLEELEVKGDTEETQEYVSSYHKHKGLYLSTDEDLAILDKVTDGEEETYVVTETFLEGFEQTVKMIKDRFSACGYSYYRISVVDDYAIKVELPKSENQSIVVLSYFSYTGEFNVADSSGTKLFPVKGDDAPSAYFKEFKAKKKNDVFYIEIRTTDAGSEKLKKMKTDASADQSGSATINFRVGENQVLNPAPSYLEEQTDNVWVVAMTDYTVAKAVAVTLNTAIAYGDLGITFEKVDNNDYAIYGAVYGGNAKNLLFTAVLIAVLAIVVLPILKMGGFGVAMAYSTLTYFGVTTFCFAFITESVLEVSAGTALVFLLGMIFSAFLSMRSYEAIKKEVSLGKTVESSVKIGFKKTILGAIDALAVLALGSVALLIGTGGFWALAIEALVCFVTAAFCALLWTRVISYLLMSASKDKYKYFRFVREDDDDE